MSDYIDRQAAIDASCTCHGGKHCNHYPCKDVQAIMDLPSVQPTLYGYNIDLLAYIAMVMEKEGVTAEYAVRTFDDISRAVRMIIEEAQQKAEEMLYERFNQPTSGN